MPATTRYSATFDRPYEEDDRPAPLGQPLQRRSRSLSLQAPSGTSLLFGGGGGGAPGQRSSSTDGGGAKEPAAGRTAAKAAVKAHSNPFQFVKVGTCPLYKKAEQQLKKVKEVKKSEVLQEEEEEWQSNLDSWKTRRRKMSEDVFKRQEEIKQFEVEEQENQISQKKTKTFSEMVESRATRGRALSLCLISSPLEFQDWEPNSRNGKKMCSVDNLFSGGSEESSNVNSEDETGVCVTQAQNNIRNGNTTTSTNGIVHQNGTSNHNNEESVAFKDDQGQGSNFIDSGLESISSHRAGDIPDSGSDFSQDSGGSMDCESPRVVTATSTGVAKLLEEFNSQSETAKQAQPVHNGVHASTNGILPKKEDKLNTEKTTSVTGTKQNIDKRTVKETINGKSPKCIEANNSKLNQNCDAGVTQERSIESENEMYVDDFEELSRKVHLPVSPEISSAHSPKDLSSLPKEGNAPETSPAVKNQVSSEISSVSSPKTSNDSNSTITDKQDLKCTEPKPQLSNDTGKAIQKKPKKSTGKLIKKPVNNSKATIEPPCEITASTNSNNRSLNIIYQSQNTILNKSTQSPSATVKNLPKNIAVPKSALNTDVPTVEKVAEEMEKMILEQLEEEERAKELAAKVQSKDTVIAREEASINSMRQLNPPKEKPPPPPQDSETKKVPSLNRASSTKRIKKEIHKRRSNFLGIENEDENSICDGSSVRPPPALKDILKAEMEIDREGRKQIENAAIQRLSIEECEIMRKEREIIENLEIEERRKRYMGQIEDLIDSKQSIIEANSNVEAERIQSLKEERILNEEQKMRLEEERYLKEREEYIRKQEDNSNCMELKTPSLVSSINARFTNSKNVHNDSSFNTCKPSLCETIPSSNTITSLADVQIEFKDLDINEQGDNTATLSSSLIPPDTTTSSTTATAPTPDLPTSLTSTKPNTLLLEKGDGEIALSDSLVGSKSETAKPIVPPKPLKKKEVIRKERERLRQEQEALQREREEHRQKLLMEQELMKNAQKSHAVDACRLGPPPPAKPTFTPQLTPLSALPSNTATSRTHNGIPANTNSDVKRVAGHTSNRPSKTASSRSRATQNESWGQQKVPSAKKQNDSLTESRYNQNHWLLHEAEMRRLAELNDRQSQQTYHGNSSSQAHLPQDDACSTNSRLKGPHINYAEHMWNYGGQPMVPTSNGPVVKYPAPVTGERAHVHASYPRKPVLEPPTKPSRVVPMERQEHMLSVSGRKRCSHCAEELGRGAAMIIESLQLYYHIQCFQCCVCQAQLGNGSCGTDVRVRNNKLHCQNCYSNDEAGLKFSQV